MQQDEESLKGIKASLKRARNLELSITSTEEKLEREKSELNLLKHKILPEQFNTVGISSLTIEADGNIPEYKCNLRPYYKAVISAKWSEDRRQAAIDELDSHGAGNLVKRTVTVSFPRSDEEECKELQKLLSQHGFSYSIGYEVHWQTLTSWLRETVEGGTMPDLDKIGGEVGQVVNLKVID